VAVPVRKRIPDRNIQSADGITADRRVPGSAAFADRSSIRTQLRPQRGGHFMLAPSGLPGSQTVSESWPKLGTTGFSRTSPRSSPRSPTCSLHRSGAAIMSPSTNRRFATACSRR
jgi:hypothetical protein